MSVWVYVQHPTFRNRLTDLANSRTLNLLGLLFSRKNEVRPFFGEVSLVIGDIFFAAQKKAQQDVHLFIFSVARERWTPGFRV